MSGTESLIISRDELGLAPLELQSLATGYQVAGPVAFGGVVRERTMAPTVPWLDYERIKHARITNGSYQVQIVVSGSTQVEMHTREQALMDAFGQVEFTLTHRVNGITRAYACMAADITPGDSGEIDEVWHDVAIQVWTASGPHRGPAST